MIDDRNLQIIVRDRETLREYEASVYLDPTFQPKLVDWIEKRRYHLQEQATEDKMLLKVDIFSFNLALQKNDSPQKMIAELSIVKAERTSIIKDIKLFNFFFFNVFNEQEYLKRCRES